jgi:3-methyladenine DNA glycosylase AlkD
MKKQKSPDTNSKSNGTSKVPMKVSNLTANEFIETLSKHQSKAEVEKNQRFFRADTNPNNKHLGVRMKIIFDTSKAFSDLPPAEIEKLLDNPYYEVRMGAVSIMDFQARNKKTTGERKKELFDLYINRHDKIDNWDLVDRSAAFVVGGYLNDKPRKILYKLVKSKNVWERRTAIVSTYYFLRQGELDETFKIAELLVHDDHDLIQKAVGSWIRHAGKQDKKRLIEFLDKYGASMSSSMLGYAIENLSKKEKEKYSNKNRKSATGIGNAYAPTKLA